MSGDTSQVAMLLTIVLGAAVVLTAAVSVIAVCVLGLAQVRSFNNIAMRYLEICSGEGRRPDMRGLGGLASAMKPARPPVGRDASLGLTELSTQAGRPSNRSSSEDGATTAARQQSEVG